MNDDDAILTLSQAGFSALCWAVVAVGAAVAIFSPRVYDTFLERVGLSAVSIVAVAAGWRAFYYGWVTNTGFLMSIALAFYVLAVFFKHLRYCGVGERRKP